MPESNIPDETERTATDDATTPLNPDAEAGVAAGAEEPAAEAEEPAVDAEADPPAPPMNRAERRGNARRGRQPIPRHVGPMAGRGVPAPGRQNYANRKSG